MLCYLVILLNNPKKQNTQFFMGTIGFLMSLYGFEKVGGAYVINHDNQMVIAKRDGWYTTDFNRDIRYKSLFDEPTLRKDTGRGIVLIIVGFVFMILNGIVIGGPVHKSHIAN